MTALLAIISVILIAIIAVQIGKVTELAGKIRGEEEMEDIGNRRQSYYMIAFLVFFLLGGIISAVYYRNYMFGFGIPSASIHGATLDRLFSITLFFTGIVFVITHILLFYFAYKYRAQKGRRAKYIPHDNKLEIVWTVIPAIVMTFLVVGGLDAWNEVMADVDPEEEFMEIEATGFQFGWQIRYPGEDGKLGEKNYQLISGTNPLGQNWEDEKNLDDFQPTEIVLPVGKKVRVRITSRDVLHNFYLPHFRVKMDAVPGIPTYFVFTPNKTTDQMRQELRKHPEYNVLSDPDDPELGMLWENFDYELACAELCGRGHYSMRVPVKIVSEEEYLAWKETQSSYYMSTIRGSENDPWNDRLFDFEVEERKAEFNDQLEAAIEGADTAQQSLELQYVGFETGSAELTSMSQYELDYVAEALNNRPGLRVELAGHTDNTGETEMNQTLSQARAEAVRKYLVDKGITEDRLVARGYGAAQPVDSNDTDAGREANRRTEIRILSVGNAS